MNIRRRLLHIALVGSLLCVFAHAAGGVRTVSAQLLSQADLEKLQELFEAGNTFLNKGDAQQAVLKYTEAIAVAPHVAMPYVNRGVAYISLSKFQEAAADADKALSLLVSGDQPSQYAAVAHQVKGAALQSQGNYSLAVEHYTKSILLKPDDARYVNNRGNAYRLLKKYDDAINDYTKSIELDPKFAMPYINRSSMYLRQKNTAAALKDVEEALRLDNSNETAYYTRASAYIELKKFPEALADYDRAISLKPRSEFYHGRSRLRFLQNQFEMAIADQTEAIRLDPSNVNAYSDRAVAYGRLGKNQLAIDDIRKAIALKSGSARLQYNLGYLLYKTGQFDAAVAEATKVMALAPNWRAPYTLRSASYAKLGNAAKAKADQAIAAKMPAGAPPIEDMIFFEVEIQTDVETEQP